MKWGKEWKINFRFRRKEPLHLFVIIRRNEGVVYEKVQGIIRTRGSFPLITLMLLEFSLKCCTWFRTGIAFWTILTKHRRLRFHETAFLSVGFGRCNEPPFLSGRQDDG